MYSPFCGGATYPYGVGVSVYTPVCCGEYQPYGVGVGVIHCCSDGSANAVGRTVPSGPAAHANSPPTTSMRPRYHRALLRPSVSRRWRPVSLAGEHVGPVDADAAGERVGWGMKPSQRWGSRRVAGTADYVNAGGAVR